MWLLRSLRRWLVHSLPCLLLGSGGKTFIHQQIDWLALTLFCARTFTDALMAMYRPILGPLSLTGWSTLKRRTRTTWRYVIQHLSPSHSLLLWRGYCWRLDHWCLLFVLHSTICLQEYERRFSVWLDNLNFVHAHNERESSFKVLITPVVIRSFSHMPDTPVQGLAQQWLLVFGCWVVARASILVWYFRRFSYYILRAVGLDEFCRLDARRIQAARSGLQVRVPAT